MNKEGLEALEKLKNIAIYEENKNNCSDLGSCCDYCGELDELYAKEINIIEKELKKAELFDFICYIILKDGDNDDYAVFVLEKIKRILMKYSDLVRDAMSEVGL